MAYKSENISEALDEDQWGFSAADYNSCQWTKLLLGQDPRSSTVQVGTGSTSKYCTLPPLKSAKDVVRDYLKGLYKYLIERLQRHDETTFNITPVQFWITVPAMWTDAAKTATIEAAQAAGFGSRAMDTIHIITEPEAAALSVLMPRVGFGALTGFEVRVFLPLTQFRNQNTNIPKEKSQNVLICDCGGGTVVRKPSHPLNYKH
jgi:hypothetical protein